MGCPLRAGEYAERLRAPGRLGAEGNPVWRLPGLGPFPVRELDLLENQVVLLGLIDERANDGAERHGPNLRGEHEFFSTNGGLEIVDGKPWWGRVGREGTIDCA